jgi:hypothetical protein
LAAAPEGAALQQPREPQVLRALASSSSTELFLPSQPVGVAFTEHLRRNEAFRIEPPIRGARSRKYAESRATVPGRRSYKPDTIPHCVCTPLSYRKWHRKTDGSSESVKTRNNVHSPQTHRFRNAFEWLRDTKSRRAAGRCPTLLSSAHRL